MKGFLCLLLVFFSSGLFSQQVAVELQNNFTISNPTVIKESFAIYDKESKRTAYFLSDDDYLYGFLLDSNLVQIGQIKTERLPKRFDRLIGHQFLDRKINLFLNTQNGRSTGVVTLDFSNGFNAIQKLDLKFRKEEYLDAVTFENNVHIMTVAKSKSQLNVYTFSDGNPYEKHVVSFEKDAFLNHKGKSIPLYDLLVEQNNSGDIIEAINVDPELPVSIANAAKYVKIYNDKNQNALRIVSDRYNEYTQIIKVDFNDYSATVNQFPKDDFKGSRLGLRSNSFIEDEKLFQFSAKNDTLNFSVIDLKSKELLLENYVGENESIPFKNTALLKEDGSVKDVKVERETKKLLSKISASEAGLSVYRDNDNYIVSFGAVDEDSTDSLISIGAFLGGLGGALVMSLINYESTTSLKATGIFDSNLNHVEGDVPKNIFNRIQEFNRDLKKHSADALVKRENDFLWSTHFKDENRYIIYKFN